MWQPVTIYGAEAEDRRVSLSMLEEAIASRLREAGEGFGNRPLSRSMGEGIRTEAQSETPGAPREMSGSGQLKPSCEKPATISLVTGILGVTLFFPCGLAAIAFGHVARARMKREYGFVRQRAKIGLVLGYVGAVMGLAWALIMFLPEILRSLLGSR